MEKSFEIEFSGKDISPESFSFRDLAEILKSVEKMIVSIVASKDQNFNSESFSLSLIGIKASSNHLSVACTNPEIPHLAFSAISNFFDGKEEIPDSSKKSLKVISAITKKLCCQADFLSSVHGKTDKIFYINPQTQVSKSILSTCETSIFGRVLRVGGKNPKVTIQTVQDKILFCESNRQIAKLLGKRLYEIVELIGNAKFNSFSGEIEEFRITNISEYEGGSIIDAFKDLSEIAGKYFIDVNPDKYVAELRNENN
ncbi:MAG: hypothetical protein HQM10_16165 [Candidatus Riflebacteria bacterium]|nr:hypothetical protein [Candidatus Riflebacteria bacterium]